jgi:hypothetical protein
VNRAITALENTVAILLKCLDKSIHWRVFKNRANEHKLIGTLSAQVLVAIWLAMFELFFQGHYGIDNFILRQKLFELALLMSL